MYIGFIFLIMKAYSQDLRDRAINLYNTGAYTRKELSKVLSISYGTICNWIRRFISTGAYDSRQHLNPGPPCRYTDKQRILDYLAENEDADGIEIRDALCPNLPMSTFYDTMSRMKITYKKRAEIQAEITKAKRWVPQPDSQT